MSKISYPGDGESARPSSSIMMQAFLVSHWEAGRPQQSSCCWVRFRSFLDKLMFYTFQLGSLVFTISVS